MRAERFDASEIAALRALCDAATPGEWIADLWWRRFYRGDSRRDAVWTDGDMLFIAASRQALPAALDEIERLREVVREATRELDASVESTSTQQINLVPNCSNAAGHTWDLDADGMECQHCGYFAPGLTTP